MSRAEMDALGWDSCDVVLVTGDAYVDHPSFGAALIGRLLEAHGFRVGVLAQPDWRSARPFAALGRPQLFFGVTAGNMDSMVNHYTSDRKPRSDDAYTPGGAAGRRPDRAALVYAHRCREAFPDVPVVIGGIEASLRRRAHYDYWSDEVRRSLLVDAKADLLLYGNAERAVVAVAHHLGAGRPLADLPPLRGSAVVRGELPAGGTEVDSARRAPAGDARVAVRLPGFDEVAGDRRAYLRAARLLHLESNPACARPLVQRHGDRELWIEPPPLPLTTAEIDQLYELPFSRRPHPSYREPIPAYEMIKASVTILRGCFGGCTFCSIAEHEGRVVQSRSAESVVREVERVAAVTPGFTGVISDLGGPTADMYRLGCRDPAVAALCRRSSCLHPARCPRLDTDHRPLIDLYRRARGAAGVKKVLIGSGVRYDLALCDPDYVRELAAHHVGGYLKVAPEHTEPGPLAAMGKPPIELYHRFAAQFAEASRAAGKEQYLIPYFLAGHPGTTDADMLAAALWLKRNRLRVDQVQVFLPTPMALATAMYHTGLAVAPAGAPIAVPRGLRVRRLHKALLRYHDPGNWPLLREALRRMGRADLIGPGRDQLVPAWQPHGREAVPEGQRGPRTSGRRRPRR
jgi:uncharacterized radical SAM protein YgiQ